MTEQEKSGCRSKFINFKWQGGWGARWRRYRCWWWLGHWWIEWTWSKPVQNFHPNPRAWRWNIILSKWYNERLLRSALYFWAPQTNLVAIGNGKVEHRCKWSRFLGDNVSMFTCYLEGAMINRWRPVLWLHDNWCPFILWPFRDICWYLWITEQNYFFVDFGLVSKIFDPIVTQRWVTMMIVCWFYSVGDVSNLQCRLSATHSDYCSLSVKNSITMPSFYCTRVVSSCGIVYIFPNPLYL